MQFLHSFRRKKKVTVSFDMGKMWFLGPDARVFQQEWEWKHFLDRASKQSCTRMHRHLKRNVSSACVSLLDTMISWPQSHGRPGPWCLCQIELTAGPAFKSLRDVCVPLSIAQLTESSRCFSKVGRNVAHHPSQGAMGHAEAAETSKPAWVAPAQWLGVDCALYLE